MRDWNPFGALYKFFNGPVAFGLVGDDSCVNVYIINPERAVFG